MNILRTILIGAVICLIAFVALHLVAVGGIYAFNKIKASQPAPAPQVTPVSPPTSQQAEAWSADSVYTVRRGDTPSSIARKYGLTAEELLKANNISDPRKLQVGQPLKVPFKG